MWPWLLLGGVGVWLFATNRDQAKRRFYQVSLWLSDSSGDAWRQTLLFDAERRGLTDDPAVGNTLAMDEVKRFVSTLPPEADVQIQPVILERRFTARRAGSQCFKLNPKLVPLSCWVFNTRQQAADMLEKTILHNKLRVGR